MELFGFATKEEKQLFLLLVSVTGVGPKMALALLSTLSVSDLRLAIVMEDEKAISRAPGVGKKTAQRIALELKDKVSQDDISAVSGSAPAAAAVAVGAQDNRAEALEALQALGYTPAEARNAVSQVKNADASVDEIIRLALRGMAGM